MFSEKYTLADKAAEREHLAHHKRLIKITVRFAIVASVLLILGVSSMFYVMAKAADWAYVNYQQWRAQNANSFLVDPIARIKYFFKQPETTIPAITAVGGSVRVVSEESQVIDVVRKSSPAVVSVIASAQEPILEQCYQQAPMDVPPEFRNFFNFDVPSLCPGKGTQTVRVGAGSGFIVTPDGYILTNRHVVEDEKAEYTVVLNDDKNFGKKVKATIVARDVADDIAVLKIDMTDLPHLSFGDSDKLQVGQTTVAIGYALGQFDNTVSKGVVSGLMRSISASDGGANVEKLRGLIQTDAAINPGNSGGPLLDIAGDVIGMNVATAEAQSIGFAIPVNTVRRIFEQVKSTGTVTPAKQPFLGVRYTPVTEALKTEKKLPYDYGIYLVKGNPSAGGASEPAVVAGSPAQHAGLKEGDIILEANGKRLTESLLLSDVIAGAKPGDKISLLVYSGGRTADVSIVLGEK